MNHIRSSDPLNVIPYKHIPVMLDEAVRYLDCKPGKIYVDGTVGGAGHSRAIVEKIMPDGLLIGIDRDRDAIENAKAVLKPYGENVQLFQGNFTQIPEFLDESDIQAVDGILLDLGLSLYQLEGSGRGFSFKRDEPLDMRMDPASAVTAEDLINGMTAAELEHIFKTYGEERYARSVARKIAKERQRQPIRSSLRLANIIISAIPKKKSRHRIHPATRVFMAIRIAVNKELENITWFMQNVIGENDGAILNPGARLCVLSFHSLEDRIVKHQMRALACRCTCPPRFPKCVCNKKSILNILTRKPLCPTEDEITANPMARSTRLRVAEKLLIIA